MLKCMRLQYVSDEPLDRNVINVLSFSAGTQHSINDSIPTLWQDYEVISGLTKVIKEKQGQTPTPLPDRREKMADFEKWLAENKANYTDQVHLLRWSVGTCMSIGLSIL